jgi:hypothetical protein
LNGGFGIDTMYGDAQSMIASARGGNDILNAAIGGINGGADILWGDATNTDEGGADLFIVGGNTAAQIKDYNEADGDRVAGYSTKDYLDLSTNSASEQQQIEGQLNAILLKGNGK